MKGLRYAIQTGTLWLVNGEFSCPVASGYAGRGAYRNDPSAVHRKSEGPLPPGRYRMRIVPHPRFAGPAIRLDPEDIGSWLHGRGDFWIHGDNATNNASRGCIVISRPQRLCVAALIDCGFTTLSVTPA